MSTAFRDVTHLLDPCHDESYNGYEYVTLLRGSTVRFSLQASIAEFKTFSMFAFAVVERNLLT